LKRQILSGTYNARQPIIIPVHEDRRYRSWRQNPQPHSKAVILYCMDVSGSMGAEQKEIVRIETFWIDTWLRVHYKGLETRYIVHDAVAREVDRDTFLPRLRRMLTEDRPVFESRDRERQDTSDLQNLLGAFEAARREVVRILRDLDAPGWSREGVSPSRGVVTVEAYALTMADHDDEHLAQIDATKLAVALGK
jgi:hypothetical protein